MTRVTTDLADEMRENPTAWMHYAACKGADITEFFPNDESDAGPTIEKYCSKCPVRTFCSDFADETKSVGIWGCQFRPYDGRLANRTEER